MLKNYSKVETIETVYVIIVNYKSEDIIFEAIKSINEEFIHIRILIMDNGSTKKSYDKLCTIKDSRVEIIALDKNTGFAHGCNYAFLYLKENYIDMKYIFILNPDAIIEKNTIYNLYSIIKNKNNIAAISPHIVNMKNQTQYSGSVLNWKHCTISNMRIGREQKDYIYTDIFHGCACLLDAEKFYEAGMFNDDTFMYYDEAFLSMEFLKLSYKILYLPNETIHHQNSLSIGNFSFLKSYYHTRNHLMFFEQYARKNSILCKYNSILKNSCSLLKHLRFHSLLGMLKGIFDFWTHKVGKLN